MGKLNFRGYLISRFYATEEIHENVMHAKNVFYSTWTGDCLRTDKLSQYVTSHLGQLSLLLCMGQ